MLRIITISLPVVLLAGIISLFTNCSFNDEKKDSSSKGSGGCFLVAEPAVIKPGESTELKPAPGASWDQYRSMKVEGFVLNSASTKGVTVTPSNSRSYPASAIRTDGSQVSCDVAVEVEGADFDAACTLIADPSSVSAAQDVTITLQVSGTEEITSVYLDSVYLGGAAGGSKAVKVTSTKTFIGKIESADKRATECSVTVEFKNPVASGECKVEPSADDNKLLADANAKFDAENATAKANKLTELAAGRADFSPVSKKAKAGFMNKETLCEAITGQKNTAGCTLGKTNNIGGLEYAQVDVSGQLYEVYGYYDERTTIKVVQATDGSPLPLLLNPATEYPEEIEVEICECVYADSFGDESNKGIASDIAAPMYDLVWYPIATGLRNTTYKGEAMSSYVHKAAYIKRKMVQPPEGTPKPECPQDWNQPT